MEYIFERKTIDEKSTAGFTITKEKVDLERWGWGVIYKDGSELHQFGANGDFHQFQEIQQEEVVMFTMYRTDDMSKRYDLVCNEPAQYFHAYKHFILDNQTRKFKIYKFGYINKKTGARTYYYILPDDRLITSDHEIENLLAFNP